MEQPLVPKSVPSGENIDIEPIVSTISISRMYRVKFLISKLFHFKLEIRFLFQLSSSKTSLLPPQSLTRLQSLHQSLLSSRTEIKDGGLLRLAILNQDNIYNCSRILFPSLSLVTGFPGFATNKHQISLFNLILKCTYIWHNSCQHYFSVWE